MSLDDHGKLGAAVIPFYLPFLVLSFILSWRHGFGRNTGWVYLLVFSIMRVLGGILLVAAEEVRPINANLYIAASILEFSGLSPLLLATLGFVRTIVTSAYQEDPMMTKFFRLLYLVGFIGLVMSIVGGTNADSTNASTLHQSTTYRHVGSILLGALYGLLLVVHVVCWMFSSRLDQHRRRLLLGISCALPFLGVRMSYSIISTFSGSPIPNGEPNTNPLARFNLANGTWWIYLVMGLLMEYAAICIYTIVGWKTPATIIRGQNSMANQEDDQIKLGYPPQQYAGGYAPQNVYVQQGYGGQAPRGQYVAPYRV